MTRGLIIGIVIGLLIVFAGWRLFFGHHLWHGWGGGPHLGRGHGAGMALSEVKVPDLSAAAREGEAIFNANCAACHGRNAAGVDGAGPPLVHIIYEPSHHADLAFQLAVRQGVRQHHWRFGNMPPVEGVSEADVTKIVTYVRELQRANGIE